MVKGGKKVWWDKYISPEQIVRDAPSEKAVLIVMPKTSSKYAGWKFWHPRSLVKHGWPYTAIRCNTGMTFRLSNGVEEVELDPYQFMRVNTCQETK